MTETAETTEKKKKHIRILINNKKYIGVISETGTSLNLKVMHIF